MKMTYAEAAREALAEMMREDPTVWAVGEDLGRGGVFGQYKGLREEFGADRISDAPIHPGGADFRLMDRRVVDRLLSCGDRRPFYRGLIGWTGGRVETLEYEEPARAAGESKYSVLRMLACTSSAPMKVNELDTVKSRQAAKR